MVLQRELYHCHYFGCEGNVAPGRDWPKTVSTPIVTLSDGKAGKPRGPMEAPEATLPWYILKASRLQLKYFMLRDTLRHHAICNLEYVKIRSLKFQAQEGDEIPSLESRGQEGLQAPGYDDRY